MKKALPALFAISSILYPGSTSLAIDGPVTHITKMDNKQETQSTEKDIPKFENEDANKGIVEFKEIMDQYGPGLQNNDAAMIQEFSSRISAWSLKAQNWITKLNEEDQKKLNTFIEVTTKKYAPQPPVVKPSDTGAK